jgi:RimJ/RimL family protein N-acetyltransferase
MTAPLARRAGQPADTAELHLEPLRPEHADELVAVLDDPALHTYTGGHPDTREHLRERYRRQAVGRSADGSQLWFNWVLRHHATGQAVGYVQATLIPQKAATEAQLAWVVGTAHQGRGYARQAAATVVDWLRSLSVDPIVAFIHPDHQASMAVARAIGMTPTDTVVGAEVRWVHRPPVDG